LELVELELELELGLLLDPKPELDVEQTPLEVMVSVETWVCVSVIV